MVVIPGLGLSFVLWERLRKGFAPRFEFVHNSSKCGRRRVGGEVVRRPFTAPPSWSS